MNEDAVLKLATLETKFDAFSDAVSRIERVMERNLARAEANDGTVRELVLQQQHTQERLNEVRRATELCTEAHRAANDSLAKRLTDTHDRVAALENKSGSALRVVAWFCGVFSAALLGTGSWAFNQISESTRVNGLQQQRIERLEHELRETREDVRDLNRHK